MSTELCLLVAVGRRWLPDLPSHLDEYPRVPCDYSLTTQSETETLSDRKNKTY